MVNRVSHFRTHIITITTLMMCMGITNVSVAMIKTCSNSEKSYLSEIRNHLLRVKTTNDESENARIAFIIASAIATKFNISVDQNTITQRLNQKTQLQRQVSFLDIKQVIHELGYVSEGLKATTPLALQSLSREILITQDADKNYIALVGQSNINLYFIYGEFNREAIVCPITKSTFLKSYSNSTFLVLREQTADFFNHSMLH